MGKFRSKLKRHAKGKSWSRGHSSTSNPENMKHRMKAKSRFFQPNLNLAPQASSEVPSALTLDALMKHDARQMYASKKDEPTVNDIAGSLKSVSLDGDELLSESKFGTFKTFQTFASTYSNCTNVSFSKLLKGFRTDSKLHKEMLAVLTALTDIIKERGGTESSTEYFLLLMETIDASSVDSDISACISLLAMGIKTVPTPVLRKKFSEAAETLIGLLERYMETDNQSIMRSLIGCMSVLLRAQEHVTWSYSSTTRYLDTILIFTIHSKPKIRKAAQHAVVSIMHGSCFMVKDSDDENTNQNKPKYHPAGEKVAKFCLNQFKPEALAKSHTLVLHTLCLLRETIGAFKCDDIKNVCESLLSIMTATNVLIRTNCFKTFHILFSSPTVNLSPTLCAKLIAAIYEYRPDKCDVRQNLAWLVVLKQGHIKLASLDLTLCVNLLPRLIDICATELWMSDRSEIVIGASNTLKELLYECVRPACETEELATRHRSIIEKCVILIEKALNAPFGDVAKYVILTFSIVFEVCGEHLRQTLLKPLATIASRYDSQCSTTVQIEHAVLSAIKSMGPEDILKKSIPITNSSGDIILEKSWMLPLLREGIHVSTFKFFDEFILRLINDCWNKWHQNKQNNKSISHTYELLCWQLWGLFPGFCRNPSDPSNFQLVARKLGTALKENPESMLPILDGFKELIGNSNEECQNEMTKRARNFLPILFNIYTNEENKPNRTFEVGHLRKTLLEVIKNYLVISPEPMLYDFFENAKVKIISLQPGVFEYEAMYDLINLLVIYQNEENLKEIYDTFIVPVLKNEKNKFVAKDKQLLLKQQKKAYKILNDILCNERESCKKFSKKNTNPIQKLLVEALKTNCLAESLHCLRILIENRKNLTIKDKLVVESIPATIVKFKEFSTKTENIAQELLLLLANMFKEADSLNDFIDIVIGGFGGDQILITNTILALRSILKNLTGTLSIKTLEFILEQILVFLVQKNRTEVEAAIGFLITFIKVLPSALVANHLETIMKSLSAMVPDTKRYCRLQIGVILKKLCKKYTAQELIKFVPGNDEVTHKRLKKIRKELSREIRRKLEHNKNDDDNEESDDDFVEGLEKKSMTIDDILADSDSDLPDDEDMSELKKKPASKKKSKSDETIIQEDIEDIVDLADIKSVGNILTSRPELVTKATSSKKQKDKNRGFKTADDGRLIISDKLVSSSDSEDDADADGNKEPISKKRSLEEDSSDDDDTPKGPSRKRKAMDSISMKSGKSGATTSKYTAGGKGIHRPVAASVKSGYSATSKMTSTSKKSIGSEYASKKAKGDMKRKGQLDPYEYIPLSRNILNKRKRAKSSGQFKNIVIGAKAGAAKGRKNRVHKAYKK